MFDRIAASWSLACSSWQVLRTDKQLIVFPIVSGLGCLLVLASFAAPFLVHPQWLNDVFQNNAQVAGQGQPVPAWVWVVAFAFYFCNYFVIVFCNAALISCALIRFNGGTPSVGDGFHAATLRLPQILAWALVSATVGLVLKVIENSSEKVGQIVSGLLGTAWTVLTFFVVPVLVVEKVGPFQAIQRSMSIMRQTWGEALVGRMGIGLIMFLVALPGIALAALGIFLAKQVPLAGVAVLALTGVYFLGLSAVGSALHGIFLGALYQYAANGQVPDDFDTRSMKRAFGSKPR